MYSKTMASLSWCVVVGLLAAPPLANAQITNGSFEASSGSFTGWNQTGDTQIETNGIGSGPTNGSFQALIATYTDGSVNPAVAPGSGVSGTALQNALNLSSPGLSGVGNGTPILGSAITQSVTMKAGDKITFDWDFLTNQVYYDVPDSFYQAPDPANNDFSFATLINGASPGPIQKLADTFYGYSTANNAAGFITGLTTTAATDPFFSETGFHTTTLVAPSDGTYLLGFGVVNAATGQANGINSAVLIDNVRFASVPEPSGYLAVAALGVMFSVRRRSARK